MYGMYLQRSIGRVFETPQVYAYRNKLLNEPKRIYNVDKTGMPLDYRPPKVVAYKGQKKVRTRTSGTKSQVTAIACINATGQVIPLLSFLMLKC